MYEMGNNKSSTRKYKMHAYIKPLTISRNKRRLTAYLNAAFEMLCVVEKFDLLRHVYGEPKFTQYMINCSYLGKDIAILPLTRSIDLLGCNQKAFLAYDKSLGEKIEMEANIVLTNLVCWHRYHDISEFMLKKLVKFKIISKSDAREIWREITMRE